MKHLILDAGGVLVYPVLGDWHIPRRAAEILGPARAATLAGGRFREVRAQNLKWLDESQIVPDLEAERACRQRFIEALDAGMGWGLSGGEIREMTDDFTDNPDRYGFFGDIKEYLARWLRQGFGLGVLSDAMPSLYPLLAGHGILGWFEAVVISTAVGATKPDPRMYRAMLDRLGADAADCLFVDDRLDNVLGAVRCGMRAVQMTRPEFPAQALWDGPVADGFASLDRMLGEVLP